jgi:cytoskeletal protein CcmA (bactofilin family)
MAGLLRGRARRWLADEQGVSLVVAMTITLAVFAIGGIWTGLATHQFAQSGRERQRDQARNAAEAGVNAAMSRLSSDPGYTGGSTLAVLPRGTGEYEVTVGLPPGSTDANDSRRYIVSTGYAPAKANPQRVARRAEQQVDLISTDSFRFALFTAPGGIAGSNNMTVNGDVYSADNLVLDNQATVSGSVTSLGSVTTSNNSTIGGDIRATGNVTINNASTTVLGNVYSGGNVALTGRVRGNVQAAGTITGGTVDGSRAQYSPPPPVSAQTAPTFTWNPSRYPAAQNLTGYPPSRDLEPAEFQLLWATNTSAFRGHYHIVCPAPCASTLNLNAKWTMTADVTIASDAPITMSREMDNGAGGAALTLTVASFAAASPAIEMSNSISPPASIKVALFAPNGSVSFRNRKGFSGAVYASAMSLEQQFTLTFVPVAVTGFTWNLASSTHFVIESRIFREVPAP